MVAIWFKPHIKTNRKLQVNGVCMKKIVLFPILNSKIHLYNFDNIRKNNLEIIGIVGKQTFEQLTQKQKYFFDEFVFLDDYPMEPGSTYLIPDIPTFKNTISKLVEEKKNTYGAENIILYHDIETEIEMFDKIIDETGIRGLDSKHGEVFRNKHLMKEVLDSKCIRVPFFGKVDPEILKGDIDNAYVLCRDKFGSCFIIKPVFGVGGEGAFKISNQDEFNTFFEYYQKHSQIEFDIEEFIDGDLYHCDFLVSNGNVKLKYCMKNTCTPLDNIRNRKNRGDILLDIHSKEYKDTLEFAEKALYALNPVNGATHMELFKSKTGEYVFLECANRPAGFFTSNVVERKFGINLYNSHFYLMTDQELDEIVVRENINAGFIAVPIKKKGILKAIDIPKLESIKEVQNLKKIGENLKETTSLNSVLTVLFICNEDKNVFDRDLEYLLDVDISVVEAEA